MRHSFQVQAAVLVAVVLTACSPWCPDQSAGWLVLTASENSREVSIGVGQGLEVRLASNPSTAYCWVLVASSESVLEAQGDAVFVPDPSGAIGAGGTEVWRFRAGRAGHQTLSLEYRRMWEDPAVAAQTVSYSITVR
jgi:inhibitor of cysteine peptidase